MHHRIASAIASASCRHTHAPMLAPLDAIIPVAFDNNNNNDNMMHHMHHLQLHIAQKGCSNC